MRGPIVMRMECDAGTEMPTLRPPTGVRLTEPDRRAAEAELRRVYEEYARGTRTDAVDLRWQDAHLPTTWRVRVEPRRAGDRCPTLVLEGGPVDPTPALPSLRQVPVVGFGAGRPGDPASAPPPVTPLATQPAADRAAAAPVRRPPLLEWFVERTERLLASGTLDRETAAGAHYLLRELREAAADPADMHRRLLEGWVRGRKEQTRRDANARREALLTLAEEAIAEAFRGGSVRYDEADPTSPPIAPRRRATWLPW